MYFYVSWYPGDPIYPIYDNDCSLLISITSVSTDWNIRQFQIFPRRLLIDSGGYRFAFAPDEARSASDVLSRQISLLAGVEIPTIICSLDFPILDDSLSSNQKDECIYQTIAFAYEMKSLLVSANLPDYVVPMAIIQGYDLDSIRFCAQELKEIGFPLYGLGSMARLRQHSMIMERIRAVTEIIPPDKLHIFGVSVTQTIQVSKKIGLHSFDSARPAKAAAYNQVFYSDPYRRFGILENANEQKGRIPNKRRLSKPLSCDCPICIEDPQQILGVGKRENIRSRALHNYFHLKRVFLA
jgi:7-cyano-7-deazaguanine tRNA-ribosyltransferase